MTKTIVGLMGTCVNTGVNNGQKVRGNKVRWFDETLYKMQYRKKNCLWEKCKHSSRIRSSEVQKYTSEASQERFDLKLMFLAQTVNSTMKTANSKISRIWEEALNSCTGWPATPIINAQHASLTNDWQTPEHSKLLTRKPVNTRQKWLWNTKQD